MTIPGAGGEAGEADPHQDARIDIAREPAGDGRGGEHAQTGDEHRLADLQSRVAAHPPEIDRVEVGQAIEPDAENEAEDAARREVAVGEGAQVDDGSSRRERAPEEGDTAGDADDGAGEDRLVLKPIVIRPLLQHVFEAAEEGGHEGETEPVEALEQVEVGLVEIHEQVGRHGDDDARHHVDEKQPVPVERIRQVAAHRRTDRRGERRHEADHR